MKYKLPKGSKIERWNGRIRQYESFVTTKVAYYSLHILKHKLARRLARKSHEETSLSSGTVVHEGILYSTLDDKVFVVLPQSAYPYTEILFRLKEAVRVCDDCGKELVPLSNLGTYLICHCCIK
jgi:hypothetical protein